ncbi:MAG: DUF3299 domain-containing protein [Betaproteobacteria bacterium]
MDPEATAVHGQRPVSLNSLATMIQNARSRPLAASSSVLALMLAAGLFFLGATHSAAWAQAGSARQAQAVRTLTWEELVPKDWDPMALFRDKPAALIREGSAAERELMREMREVWDKAPTRSELKGQRVRLPGYVVPLDMVGDKLQDFLLVPYFGACIHSPPPPANQIVHITLKRPQALRTMDVVWVTGMMDIERQDTGMGVSGYAIQADAVEPYKAPEGKR